MTDAVTKKLDELSEICEEWKGEKFDNVPIRLETLQALINVAMAGLSLQEYCVKWKLDYPQHEVLFQTLKELAE